jgi:hypothetical protein
VVHLCVSGSPDVVAHHADATALPSVAQQDSQMNCCDAELPMCAIWVNSEQRH